jgi:hypothetical protein
MQHLQVTRYFIAALDLSLSENFGECGEVNAIT